MSALSNFEHFVESVVEGSFTRLMHTQLQPVEIAKRLARAIDREQTISAGKTFIPNEFHVALNPEDFRLFEPSRELWEGELADYVASVAAERGLTVVGQPIVVLRSSEGVARHRIEVATKLVGQSPGESVRGPSELAQTQRIDASAIREAIVTATKQAHLVLSSGSLAGVTLKVTKPVVLLGRAVDNDIVLDEPRVSRYHAEIRLRGDLFHLRDLKSTNGTRVNGEEAAERVLSDGDLLSLAGVEMIFRIG